MCGFCRTRCELHLSHLLLIFACSAWCKDLQWWPIFILRSIVISLTVWVSRSCAASQWFRLCCSILIFVYPVSSYFCRQRRHIPLCACSYCYFRHTEGFADLFRTKQLGDLPLHTWGRSRICQYRSVSHFPMCPESQHLKHFLSLVTSLIGQFISPIRISPQSFMILRSTLSGSLTEAI